MILSEINLRQLLIMIAGSEGSLFRENNFNDINYVSFQKNNAVKLNRIIPRMEDYFLKNINLLKLLRIIHISEN